ncbi:hypothetical protein C8Q79DRAFT_348123 [Trametes meyenii]|nr:hypothetical protein C8Q79DRAFT_348123 [Trametes meyenii]
MPTAAVIRIPAICSIVQYCQATRVAMWQENGQQALGNIQSHRGRGSPCNRRPSGASSTRLSSPRKPPTQTPWPFHPCRACFYRGLVHASRGEEIHRLMISARCSVTAVAPLRWRHCHASRDGFWDQPVPGPR